MCAYRKSGIRLSLSLCLLTLLFVTGGLRAEVTTSGDAQLVVTGWLVDNVEPLGAQIGVEIADVETFTGRAGEPIYHIVRLSPSGFVVVAADDLVEPILAFSDAGDYEPSAEDPLTALVTPDLDERLAAAYGQSSGQIGIQSVPPAQSRWRDLMSRAELPDAEIRMFGMQSISDVRVAPLLKTRWAQGNVCSDYCYNYYTPNRYLAGCVAVAMAQVMYYHRHPAGEVGRRSFAISVTSQQQTAYTRGGDGTGGLYLWDDMALSPNCSTTAQQRQAIGALCYDAGLAVRMEYGPKESLADAFLIPGKLTSVFKFSNAVNGAGNGKNIGLGLTGMVNPNLDAQLPVILTITGNGGHAIVADGYGYDLSTETGTLYHHLNMGWGGTSDLWYNLPDVGKYNSVVACVYNIYAEGEGEIVSGRVTDDSGRPVSGAVVTARLPTAVYTATTNDKGIYALPKLPSNSVFTVEAQKPGLAFTKRTTTTGLSSDWKTSTGNRWGVDFVGVSGADSHGDRHVDFTDFAILADGLWSYQALATFAAGWLTKAAPLNSGQAIAP